MAAAAAPRSPRAGTTYRRKRATILGPAVGRSIRFLPLEVRHLVRLSTSNLLGKPPYEEMVIEGLTDEEEDNFVSAISDA